MLPGPRHYSGALVTWVNKGIGIEIKSRPLAGAGDGSGVCFSLDDVAPWGGELELSEVMAVKKVPHQNKEKAVSFFWPAATTISTKLLLCCTPERALFAFARWGMAVSCDRYKFETFSFSLLKPPCNSNSRFTSVKPPPESRSDL